jgi:hypothetical protein
MLRAFSQLLVYLPKDFGGAAVPPTPPPGIVQMASALQRIGD